MRIFVLTTIISLVALVGCDMKTEKSNDTINDHILLAQASEKLIGQFQSSLKNELMTAMKEGGAPNAITVCQTTASELAASQSTDLLTIRRVAIKNRNVDNAASEKEAEVLSRFCEKPELTSFTKSSISNDSTGTYTYYKPIKTGKFCLKCHGPVESLDADVKSVLAKAYPDDKATGHSIGDLRGMFVVDIKWPEAREVVASMLADSM